MSSSDEEHSPSLADRLVTACDMGDLPSAKAAIADGASVNAWGSAPGWDDPDLPLRVAVAMEHHDVVVLLLSHGADPNGDHVMYSAVGWSTAGILQLLIDAGGNVNRKSYGQPPLFTAAVGDHSEDSMRVLLAQPSLHLTLTYDGKSSQQYARDKGKPALADMIAQEVSGRAGCMVSLESHSIHGGGVAVAGRWRGERRWYDHCLVV